MTLLDIFTVLASVATAIGVGVAAIQIRVGRLQSLAQFEDGFAKEYREVAANIPTRALLGDSLSDEENKTHFDKLFRYFDLSNEQIFLRMRGRIGTETWHFWRDGMESNFKKPAFRWAWGEIEKSGSKEFSEFRRLVRSEFNDDPQAW